MELDIQRFADGKVVIQTELDTKNFKNGLDRMQNTAKGAGTSLKSIVAGLGITKLISMGFNAIRNSMDDAITRLDTLNNFPKVMSNLGVSTKDAEASIKKMSDKLAGLPTTLDQGASAVQRFTSKNGDVKKSTNIFLALNNAILAGGAPTEMQATALEQLSQAYAKGKPDMMEWRSAMSAMPAQLKQVAVAMGYVNADELGEALRTGKVSMDEFMEKITELNTKGANGFKSFEEQARNSTGGIRTSITVAKTQIVKGVADMIEGLNKGLKKAKLGSLSQIIANFGKGFKKELDKVADMMSKIDFKKVINAMKVLIPVVGALTSAFIGYHTALKAIKIQQSITSAITAMTNPIGLAIAGVAGLTAGILLLSKATEGQKTAQQKVNQTLVEYDDAMKQANEARQASLDKNMNEIAGIESLYNELQSLVDANGKVKEGYEDRVSFIIGELNKALGTEITMTDGVINNYNKMKSAIDEVILAKRAKYLLDAEEKKYNEAKNNEVKLEEALATATREQTKAEQERNEVLKQIQSTYGLTNEQLKQVAQSYSYIDENGKKVNIAFDSLGKKLGSANASLAGHNAILKQASDRYDDNQKTIKNYEASLVNLKKGNYQAVMGLYEDTANYNAKTKQNTIATYESGIKAQEAHLARLKANKSKYDTDAYNAEVNATEVRINKLKEGLEKEKATISTAHTEIKGKYSKLPKDSVNAYSSSLDKELPFAQKKSKDFAKNATSGMPNETYKNGHKSGVSLDQGFINGMASLLKSVANGAKAIGDAATASLKNAIKQGSPSKITRQSGNFFGEGFILGIADMLRSTLKTVDNYGSSVVKQFEKSTDMTSSINKMQKQMQSAVNLQQGKMSTNIQTGKVFNNLVATTPVNVNLDASIEMDKQKVGRMVTPEVSRTIKTGGGV